MRVDELEAVTISVEAEPGAVDDLPATLRRLADEIDELREVF